MYKDGTRGTSSKNRLVTPMRSNRCLNEVSFVYFFLAFMKTLTFLSSSLLVVALLIRRGKARERKRGTVATKKKKRQASSGYCCILFLF